MAAAGGGGAKIPAAQNPILHAIILLMGLRVNEQKNMTQLIFKNIVKKYKINLPS